MKVPEYIKKAIRDRAKASSISLKNDKIIRDWFQKNEMNNDSVIDPYIDSIEFDNKAENFIEYLENEQFDYGNEKYYDEDL